MSIIFPSSTSWITPRTTEAQVDSNNCMLILNQKISEVQKVLVKASTIAVKFRTPPIPAEQQSLLSDLYYAPNDNARIDSLDITNYIVEQAKYGTLPIENLGPSVLTQLCVNNTHYYVQNEKTIYIIGKTYKQGIDFFNIVSVWNMSIQASFTKLVESASGGIFKKNTNGEFVSINANIDNIGTLNNNPMSAQFRVYYVPLGESVKLQVPKTNPKLWQFCIPYSQQQPMVDNVTLGREMQSVANRTGCEQKQVLRTIPGMEHYRKPGSFWRERDANGNLTGNVWRLVRCEITFYCDSYIRVLEIWSKNWSLRSENVPIDRSFRSWKIPADIVQRNLLHQEYCLLTTKGKLASLPDDALFSEDAKKIVLNKLKTNTTNYTQMECMWFYRQGVINERIGVILSASAFGFGKSLVFSAKTKDNLSAGVQRVPKQSGDTNYQFCKDVYYCRDDGELTQLYVQIGEGVNNSDDTGAYRYPEFHSLVGGEQINSPAGYALFKDANNANVFNVQKDASEQLNFTYQLHLLTDSGFLVIGSTWAAENGLVKTLNGNTIKVWYLTNYIPASAEVMTSFYGTVAASGEDVDFSVNLDAGTITFGDVSNMSVNGKQVVGICVTDENNQVLIAYNDNKGATFTANYTADYSAIYATLKEYLAQRNG